jgi:hypothetical protein
MNITKAFGKNHLSLGDAFDSLTVSDCRHLIYESETIKEYLETKIKELQKVCKHDWDTPVTVLIPTGNYYQKHGGYGYNFDNPSPPDYEEETVLGEQRICKICGAIQKAAMKKVDVSPFIK